MKCINIDFVIFIKILHQEVNKYPVVIYKAKFCENVSGVPKWSAYFKYDDGHSGARNML